VAGQRVLLDDLGGGVAAAGVGDALVGTELVRAVDQAGDRIEFRGFGIVPEVGDVLIGGHGAFRWKGEGGGLEAFTISLNH
jgi:hypothetical protein